MKRRSRNLVLVGVAALGALASQVQAQGLGTSSNAPIQSPTFVLAQALTP